MLRIGGILLAMGLMVGCTGNPDTMVGYFGVPGDHVTTDQDRFTVHDRPSLGRMLVVASTESSLGNDFMSGRRIGTTSAGIPYVYFGDAGRTYLDETGRSNCRITGTQKVLNSQYEVVYVCG